MCKPLRCNHSFYCDQEGRNIMVEVETASKIWFKVSVLRSPTLECNVIPTIHHHLAALQCDAINLHRNTRACTTFAVADTPSHHVWQKYGRRALQVSVRDRIGELPDSLDRSHVNTVSGWQPDF